MLVASLFLFTACSKDKEQPKTDGPSDEELEILNEKDMPIVNEEVDLEFFAGQAPCYKSRLE